MRKLLAISALIAATATPALAQTPVPSPTPPTVRLAFEQDGVNTDGFRLYDGASQVGGDITGLNPVTGTTYEVPFPALTPGIHNLTAKAFNIAGESPASNVLAVRVVVIPSSPNNLRIARFFGFGRKPAIVLITAELTDQGWQPVLKMRMGKYRSS